MRRTMTGLAACLVAMAVFAARPAHAVMIDFDHSMLMGNDVEDCSTPLNGGGLYAPCGTPAGSGQPGGELDFDAYFNNDMPIWLAVKLGQEDDGFLELAFSAILINDTGHPWTRLHLGLEGPEGGPDPTFAEANVLLPVGASVSFSSDMKQAWISFNPAELNEAQIGEPSNDPAIDPGQDWFIDLNGLGPGDTFNIHISTAIPEPVTGLLTMLSLGSLALATRRRR